MHYFIGAIVFVFGEAIIEQSLVECRTQHGLALATVIGVILMLTGVSIVFAWL